MQNADNIQTSVAAVRGYKGPLKMAQMELLRETLLASRSAICPGCPVVQQHGSRTGFAFGDISRFRHVLRAGRRPARRASNIINCRPKHREASGVDLAALRDACQFKTDYPEIIRRAERYFA